jgi:hypothetical protein
LANPITDREFYDEVNRLANNISEGYDCTPVEFFKTLLTNRNQGEEPTKSPIQQQDNQNSIFYSNARREFQYPKNQEIRLTTKPRASPKDDFSNSNNNINQNNNNDNDNDNPSPS